MSTKAMVLSAISSGATNRGTIQRKSGLSMSRIESLLRELVASGEITRTAYGVYALTVKESPLQTVDASPFQRLRSERPATTTELPTQVSLLLSR
ncbi:MAG: hypothetical protein JWN34_3777 [Bryobacterales bacterium]|nr:hypothetical protein [Bryobacterales bacterium]